MVCLLFCIIFVIGTCKCYIEIRWNAINQNRPVYCSDSGHIVVAYGYDDEYVYGQTGWGYVAKTLWSTFDGYRFKYYGAYQKNQCIYLSDGGYIKSLNAFDLSRLQFNHNGNIFCYACDADGNIIEPKRVPIIYAKHSLVYCGIECMENFIIMNDADCDCNIGYLAIEKS